VDARVVLERTPSNELAGHSTEVVAAGPRPLHAAIVAGVAVFTVKYVSRPHPLKSWLPPLTPVPHRSLSQR